MPREHRQHPGAQHIGLARRVRPRVRQRTPLLPPRPQPGQCQKFNEVGQLPHRRGGAIRLPANPHATPCRPHTSARQKHFLCVQTLQFRLTHRVASSNNAISVACQRFGRVAPHQLRFLGSRCVSASAGIRCTRQRLQRAGRRRPRALRLHPDPQRRALRAGADFSATGTRQEVLDEQAAHWGPQIRARGLAFELSSEGQDTGVYNPTLLRAVLSNLLRNALHYTDKGRVRLVTERGGLRVEESVRGIAQQQHEHVFQPFVRGEHARGEGLGLGLSLVRRICTHQGWTTRLRDLEPSGTCFHEGARQHRLTYFFGNCLDARAGLMQSAAGVSTAQQRADARHDDGDRSPHRLSWVTRLQRPRQSAYAATAKRSSLAFMVLRGLRPSPLELPAHLCPPCRNQYTPTQAHSRMHLGGGEGNRTPVQNASGLPGLQP